MNREINTESILKHESRYRRLRKPVLLVLYAVYKRTMQGNPAVTQLVAYAVEAQIN